MIIHKACGQRVYVDLSDIFKLITSFGINDDHLIPGCGEYIISKKTSSRIVTTATKFYCKVCKENVEQKDLAIICDNNGAIIPIEDAYQGKDCGGLYCKPCADKLNISVIPLLNSIQTIQINPNGRN